MSNPILTSLFKECQSHETCSSKQPLQGTKVRTLFPHKPSKFQPWLVSCLVGSLVLFPMRHLWLLLLPLCFSSLLCSASGLSSDGVALLSLLRHWTSVPHPIKCTWNLSDSTPCSWLGIQCDHYHNVISLNLTDYGIEGKIGPEIGLLSQLQRLVLINNGFSGKIPSELGNCSLLEYLELYGNNFSGKIPMTFKNLQNLNYFSLPYNQLTGQIPEFIPQIPNLQFVDLSFNSLTGSIPSEIGDMSELLNLYLQNNQLSGEIPSSIGNCSKLQDLALNENKFHGTLPENLNNLHDILYLNFASNNLSGTVPLGSGNCKNLSILDLSYNVFSGGIPSSLWNCSGLTTFSAVSSGFTGSIPSSIGLLRELSHLWLPVNHLSGKIPPEIGNCKSLTQLHLYSNQLEGEIPSELGELGELQDLELFSNRLTGEIPLGVWKIQSLEQIHVYNNSLSGELPLEMTELKHLKNISLFNNHFSGVIPQTLGIKSRLVLLDLTNNKFTGNIPPNLCSGKKLTLLTLGFNQLQGSIPPDVGMCTTLTRLILEENNFTGPLPDFEYNPNLTFMGISGNNINGSIPPSLGNCSNVTDLILSNNNLAGHIPRELGRLVNLKTLHLDHNRLEGPLPPELSKCTKMNSFDVGSNFLNGSFPPTLRSWTALITLILRENRFHGGIPDFLSEINNLSELQLGGNMFGGKIPGSIGALQNLRYGLNLSANGLIGEIPQEMGKLMNLVNLDLSQNNLTGSIGVLAELSSLLKVNVSYNSFNGPVPETLMKLFNSDSSSFSGNPGLCIRCSSSNRSDCYQSSRHLKPCDDRLTNKKGLSKVQVAMITLGSSICFVLLLLLVIYMCVRGGKSKQGVGIAAKEGTSSLLSKVMDATANLSDRFIIGRGAHGVVYKASIDAGRVFAVKKLAFSGNKGKSMVREIQTLGMIRHRNLVKLEDFWLRKDFGLILYPYMPNGSLHEVLHEKHPPRSLEWNVLYKIAVGIAHGLAYLHFDCDPPILHRDIKPKNILLDSDMEPHIADFGIAKLLDQSSISAPSIFVPGTVGYIAPEKANTTANNRESDVYSYGVVLLELITRKKAVDPSFKEGEGVDIVSWVRTLWVETEDIHKIADSSLAGQFMDSNVLEQATKVLLVALKCTEKDPRARPTMRDVIKQLEDANPRIRGKKLPSSHSLIRS